MITPATYRDWITELNQQLMSSRQRRAVVLCGEHEWTEQTVRLLLETVGQDEVLWVSETQAGALSAAKAKTQLGRENQAIVFDTWDGFNVDAFAAVAGTLRGGGMLFMLMPAMTNWQQHYPGRFIQRVEQSLQHDGVVLLQQHKPLPVFDNNRPALSPDQQVEVPYRTLDQQQVVETIEQVAQRHNKVQVVLVSDRGRGKSASLGFAAAHLLQQGMRRILLTAPGLRTTEAVFEHAQQCLPGAHYQRGLLQAGNTVMQFMAPDALLQTSPEADLLMVDEAAAIPLPMLQKLLALYPFVIFASTVHGYEGSGRGFALRFNKVLDELCPDWIKLAMDTPIRWSKDDPLEAWIDHLLCLDADLLDMSEQNIMDINNCQVSCINRDELVKQDDKLHQLFALLVYAHYQTQPSDLLRLLDDPDIRVYQMQYQDKLVAAALVIQEGGHTPALSSAIYRGERRPSGHLLPQTLTFHAGCEMAATLNYARVMRIAVHPQLQSQGLGSTLLQQIVEEEKLNRVDIIGASFGANVALLNFWHRAGFEMVRLGMTRDRSSGEHSAVMLMPLTQTGELLVADARQRFQRHLPGWLDGPLNDLPFDMQQLLLHEAVEDSEELLVADWQDIESFATTHRGYETCMTALKKFFNLEVVSILLSEQENTLVSLRIRQDKEWSELVTALNLSGKAEAIRLLRQVVARLLQLPEIKALKNNYK